MTGLVLLALLSTTPLEETRARLSQRLEKELQAGLVDFRVDREDLVLTLSSEALFEKKDSLWKVLHALAVESRRAGPVRVRVDLAHHDARLCGQRRDGVNAYLFEKQKANAGWLSVRATCGEASAEVPQLVAPASLALGALTVEARRTTFPAHEPLSAVSLHVTNGADAGVDLSVDGLELLLAGEPVRAVPVTGLWFHQEAQQRPYVQVRENGQGPLRFTVPPGEPVLVMLQFAPAEAAHRVAARRVRFTVDQQQGAVAGPVVRVGFSPLQVKGTPRPVRQ